MPVKDMSRDEFETACYSRVFLADFYAPWCGACRTQEPILDRLAERYKDNTEVKIAKVNTDNEGGLARHYKVSSIPRLFLFQGSEEPAVRLSPGVHSEEDLAREIDRLLGTSSINV